MLAMGCANVPELVGLTFINMSYNDFTLEQLNFIRIHWDYSELCKAIKEKPIFGTSPTRLEAEEAAIIKACEFL